MKPKHLPWQALILMIIDEVKSWWPLLLIAGFNFTSKNLWWSIGALLVLVLLCVGFSVIRYWRFTYLLAPQMVTINSGLFIRKVRHIPYSKIQTVQRQQWFFLKPFDLESVRLETASQDGNKGEASLYAVSLQVADEIEARRKTAARGGAHSVATAADTPGDDAVPATPQRQGDSTAATPGPLPDTTAPADYREPQYAITTHDLNLYALTSLSFFPIIAGLLWLFDHVTDYVPDAWLKHANHYVAQLTVIVIVAFVLLILLVSLAISYLNLLQKYYHFTLDQNADTLTTSRGFFKQVTVSVRLARIQAVRFKQSIIRQWLHLLTIQALTASNAADDESDNDLVLLPVVPQNNALTTIQQFITWLPTAVKPLTLVPRRAHWYYYRNIWLGNGVLIVAAVLSTWYWQPRWLGWGALLALLWLILITLQARYAARQSGIVIQSAELLVLQSGRRWTRERFFVRRADIQSLALSYSIWLAHKHLAKLTINVRQGDNNQAVAISYLAEDTARAVLAWYRRQDAAVLPKFQ